jgi:hypothetical protein
MGQSRVLINATIIQRPEIAQRRLLMDPYDCVNSRRLRYVIILTFLRGCDKVPALQYPERRSIQTKKTLNTASTGHEYAISIGNMHANSLRWQTLTSVERRLVENWLAFYRQMLPLRSLATVAMERVAVQE